MEAAFRRQASVGDGADFPDLGARSTNGRFFRSQMQRKGERWQLPMYELQITPTVRTMDELREAQVRMLNDEIGGW